MRIDFFLLQLHLFLQNFQKYFQLRMLPFIYTFIPIPVHFLYYCLSHLVKFFHLR